MALYRPSSLEHVHVLCTKLACV